MQPPLFDATLPEATFRKFWNRVTFQNSSCETSYHLKIWERGRSEIKDRIHRPKNPNRLQLLGKTRAQNTVTEEPGPEPGNQQYCPTRSRSRSRNTKAAAATTVPQAQREPAAAQADRAGGTTSQQPPHPRTSGEVPRNYTSSTISSSFPSIVPSTNFLQGSMERESQPSQYGISQTDDTDLVQQNEQTSYTEPQGQGLPQGPGARSRTYHPNQSPLHPASDRLGTSTPQNIREKIWRGEFIDLNVLLVDSQDKATQVMQNAAEQERANLTVAQVEGTWVLKPFTPPPPPRLKIRFSPSKRGRMRFLYT